MLPSICFRVLLVTIVTAGSSVKSLSARDSSNDCPFLEKKAVECVRTGIGFLDRNFEPPRDLKSMDQFCTYDINLINACA